MARRRNQFRMTDAYKRPVPLHMHMHMQATWLRADQIGWLQRVYVASLCHEKAVGGMKPAKS